MFTHKGSVRSFQIGLILTWEILSPHLIARFILIMLDLRCISKNSFCTAFNHSGSKKPQNKYNDYRSKEYNPSQPWFIFYLLAYWFHINIVKDMCCYYLWVSIFLRFSF